MPKRIAYWAFIRLAVSDGHKENYPGNPAERTTGDVLKVHGSWAR